MAGAKELNTPYVLIDDKAARVLAEAMILYPTGLIGLLRLAKLTGKIESLKDCLDRLIENNHRISKRLYKEILIEVDEILAD
ncbi:MAG: hypothetical protein CVU90_01735 [Firmicutes bacterium HGW-Firmicutes-15]|nr:MAG: hypothetical protein CVU90_01735 [Firmicutes bacterium HGW-Firmicutes-15]